MSSQEGYLRLDWIDLNRVLPERDKEILLHFRGRVYPSVYRYPYDDGDICFISYFFGSQRVTREGAHWAYFNAPP